MNNLNYSANDIQTLSPGRAFRERIGMYLSADLQEAMDLGLRELIYNAQDEYSATEQKDAQIKITIDSKTNTICAEDNMRGIPCQTRDDGINSLTAAFLIPHSGAKYDDKTAYSSSVGCNGEGLKVLCHTAQWLKVEVRRENKIFFQSFHETSEGAIADDDVKIIGACTNTGTKITYVPSTIVYGKDTRINIEVLSATLRQLSYFSKGLKIILEVDGVSEEFISKNGLIDGLDTTNSLSKPFQYFYKTEDCEVELALQWVKKRGQIRGYANGLYMVNGGVFISQFKSSLTRTFNSLSKRKYNGEVIRDSLDGFVSVKVRVGQFSNQAKTALANKEAGTATSAAITEALKHFHQTRENDFNVIVTMLDKIEKAEAAADKAREAILSADKKLIESQKKKVINSTKLKDARKLGQDSILLLCEGDSGASSVTSARDADKYGVLALRGKIISPFNNTEEKFYANEEVQLLMQAMNISPTRYDSKKLRYGKIGICSDADSDGYHIGLLIMSVLYKIAPQFLLENRLCWLRTPLWIVKNKRTEQYFFTDEEMDLARKQGKAIGEIQRAKGIGSLSPDQAHEAMFTEKNQRLETLVPTPEALQLLVDLMGDDNTKRKDFVFNNIDFSIIRE